MNKIVEPRAEDEPNPVASTGVCSWIEWGGTDGGVVTSDQYQITPATTAAGSQHTGDGSIGIRTVTAGGFTRWVYSNEIAANLLKHVSNGYTRLFQSLFFTQATAPVCRVARFGRHRYLVTQSIHQQK